MATNPPVQNPLAEVVSAYLDGMAAACVRDLNDKEESDG